MWHCYSCMCSATPWARHWDVGQRQSHTERLRKWWGVLWARVARVVSEHRYGTGRYLGWVALNCNEWGEWAQGTLGRQVLWLRAVGAGACGRGEGHVAKENVYDSPLGSLVTGVQHKHPGSLVTSQGPAPSLRWWLGSGFLSPDGQAYRKGPLAAQEAADGSRVRRLHGSAGRGTGTCLWEGAQLHRQFSICFPTSGQSMCPGHGPALRVLGVMRGVERGGCPGEK